MKNRTPPAYLRARLADRGGFVILWAIFGFVVMVSLATLAMRVAGSERLAANAAVESTRSFYAAETGLRKTLAELEDSVFQALQPGDSLVGDGLVPGGGADSLGWTPLDSLTSYHTVLHRVDGDTTGSGQRLYQLTVKGRGEGYYGGESVLSLSLTPPTAWENQAIMWANELVIGAGQPEVLGSCGGVYAGGDIDGNGTLIIEGGGGDRRGRHRKRRLRGSGREPGHARGRRGVDGGATAGPARLLRGGGVHPARRLAHRCGHDGQRRHGRDTRRGMGLQHPERRRLVQGF